MSPHEADIASRLHSLIAATARVDRNAVREEATFIGDLGMESVELMRLVCRVERTFGIVLETESLVAVRTVAELVSVVAARTAAAGDSSGLGRVSVRRR